MTDRPNRAEVGKTGEDTACRWLISKGYKIIERNYWKKFGEIDIVATKDGTLHFVEVKSVTRSLAHSRDADYDALDNVHPWKLKRLSRAIQIYLSERKVDDEADWQVDIITIELDYDIRNARVRFLDDVEL